MKKDSIFIDDTEKVIDSIEGGGKILFNPFGDNSLGQILKVNHWSVINKAVGGFYNHEGKTF